MNLDSDNRIGVSSLEKLQAETIKMQEQTIKNLERENRRLKQDLYVWENR